MNASRTWLRRLDAFFYPPAPAERLAMLRVLVGGFAVIYLVARFSSFTAGRFHDTSFAPVGPASFLSAPLPAPLVYAQTLLAIGSGAAFTAGFHYRVLGPLFAALLLWVTSYRSSWGMIFHTENLLTLHVLLLAAAPAADAVAYDSRSRVEPPGEHGRYGWAIRALCVITVITYLLAGIAKTRISGSDWLTGEILRGQIAYDNLRKIELGSVHSPLGAWVVRWPWVFPPLAALTLLLELGAPLALASRKLGRLWVVAAMLFHWGVLALMAIAFPYPLTGIAYASYFDVEKLRRLRHAPRLLRR
jgi:hypothetical protein